MNEKIENIKKSLPEETPILNGMKINNLQMCGEITEEEANELLNWNFGFEMFGK